ncbi:hypothetical protein IKZ80_04960 [bacterium]|nr:hypothetical protein [bacterium]MBR6462559.1 hypothetical protein [bacterium]
MKKMILATLVLGLLFLQGCSSLSLQEKQTIRSFQANGISVDHPAGLWEKPASPLGAGLLNILPGCGNFYLACGDGADNDHWLYGALNLLFWPLSITWGIPEAVVDAGNINERELIYFYTFDAAGEQALADRGLQLNNRGQIEKK